MIDMILNILGGLAMLVALLLLVAVVRAIRAGAGAKKTTKEFTPTVDQAKADQAAGKLSRMIAHETVSSRESTDLEKFNRFHQLLEELFPRVAGVAEKHNFNGALLWRVPGKDSSLPPLVLMSHMDVVEATGEWTHPPFSGAIADGKIWGRGAVDTKGALCALIQAIEELLAEGYSFSRDIYICSSNNEEISGPGAPAVVAYLKERGIRPMLVLDEGGAIQEASLPGVEGLFAMVGVMEKGYGDVRLVAKSTGGHASAPGKDTPLVRLGKCMAYIERTQPFRRDFTPAVRTMYKALAPYMSFGYRMLFANLWLFGPVLKRMMPKINLQMEAMLGTTCAFTMAQGSGGCNVIPQQAWVNCNLRYMSNQNAEEVLGILRNIAKRFNIEVEYDGGREATPVTKIDSEGYSALAKALEEIYPGMPAIPYILVGGTDCRHFNAISDSCVRFSPIYMSKQQLSAVHAIDENVDVAAIAKAVEFYRQLIKNV